MIFLDRVGVVFGYWRGIKYSVNVLIGALESKSIGLVDVYLASKDELMRVLRSVRRKYEKVIYAQTLLTTELPSLYRRISKITYEASRLGITSVAGGPHASGDPYGTLLSLGFNYAFLGEAENAFPELIKAFLDNGDPSHIEGVASREGCNVRLNGRGFVKDLNEYPPYAPRHRLFNPIEISRGCPFACKYCQVSYVFSSIPRHRDPEEIFRWGKHLIRIGIKDVRFITPNALGYGSHGKYVDLRALSELIDVLSKLRKAGGKVYLGTFPSEIRPEQVTRETVKLLAGNVDNKRVVIGAQSGSEQLLRRLNRGHTPDEVLKAVNLLRKHGFGVDVDYIFGLPGESEEDIQETISHMKKVVALGGRIHAHVFLPLPGTPLSLAPPGKVKPELRKAVNFLLGKGKVFGSWIAQEELARRIAMLRDKGVILITAKRAESYRSVLPVCKSLPVR